LYAEATAWIGPTDVVELIADNAAGAALNTAFVRENHTAIRLRLVTGGGTAVNTLLLLALQTDIVVDNPDMRLGVDVIGVYAQFLKQSVAIPNAVNDYHVCRSD
jgi:hypothetical protein